MFYLARSGVEIRIQCVLGLIRILVIATWKAISIFFSRGLCLVEGQGLPSAQAVVFRAAAGAGLGGVRVVHDVPDHVSSGPVVAGQLLPVVLPVKVGHVTAPDLLGLGPDELQIQNELLQSISVSQRQQTFLSLLL